MRMDETRERVLARLEQASETALAARIREERLKRGLSQEKLAEAVEALIGPGFPQSAVSKIERSHNRRAITVDEAIALAKVFEIPLEQLLLPPTVELDELLGIQLQDAGHTRANLQRVARGYGEDLHALLEFVETNPDAAERLRAIYDFWKGHEAKRRPGFYWVLEEIFLGLKDDWLDASWRVASPLSKIREICT